MNRRANNLLIDLGNTRLKWAIGNEFSIEPGEPVLNSNLNSTSLIQLWRDIKTPDQIAIAFVCSQEVLGLVTNVANELWPDIKINMAKSEAENYGITNVYPQPEKLGVDRWLGMIAAYHKCQTDICIVGCGTAVTVDMVNSEGRHLGGLICPGLRLMKESLSQNTKNLPFTEFINYPSGLADCTEAAIHNGVLLAICGLIEQSLINRGNSFKLILTGGDADFIAAHLSTPSIIDTNLVLNGLALTLSKSL
jgi:type III pantothenate kinase